jgi:thiol-disulfide isomerase/thioredoxin
MHKLLSLSNFNDISNENKTVIVKVGADWCGSCNVIKPLYNQFAEINNNSNIIFTEINTEDADDELLEFIDVKALPTFLFYKNKELTNKIIGFDKQNLAEYINNLDLNF